jgi:rubrerythrin
MAEQTEHMGMNKTGVQMSPLQTKHMLDDDNVLTRGQPGDETQMAELRQSYITGADGFGSIPVPGTMKGMASVALDMLKGDNPKVLIDKLSERLAMERTATRLYDALLTKLPVVNEGKISITLEDVASIRGDEARHALLIRDAIASIGGDPTAMTPSADNAGVEAMGLVQVLSDPRSSLAQSLHALLTAELSDGVGWETLIALAHEHGQRDMADGFGEALLQERKHQLMIQAWYEEAIGLDTSALHPAAMSSGQSSSANVAAASGPGVPAPGDPGTPRPGSTS